MIGVLSSNQEIQGLIDIISNTLEAFTTALFIAPKQDGKLELVSYQSLSRNIDLEVVIGPGEGLIGWVHKNGKPINVDQFETDTRRLLFYKTDESIKSFMAVPLGDINGVLAVDSKQKYIFTEKSQKILYQFSLSLHMMVKRLEIARHTQSMSAALAFLSELEELLGLGNNGKTIDLALSLIRKYAGAEACFLTALIPVEPDKYEVIAQNCSFEVDLEDIPISLNTGLSGWIMQNQRPLILERLRTDSERSYIFYPDEPLGKLLGFAGFPVMSGQKLRGALILGSYTPLGLDKPKTLALNTASSRLAIGLETEVLKSRVSELAKLDPQVGLPHKTYFSSCLNEILKEKKARSRAADTGGHPNPEPRPFGLGHGPGGQSGGSESRGPNYSGPKSVG